MNSAYRILIPVLAVTLSIGVISLRSRAAELRPEEATLQPVVYAPPVETVETHVLERGETLSDVLGRASITGRDMAEMLLSLRQYVNPRRLVDGVEVTVRRWARNEALRALEVRVNADTTVRMQIEAVGWSGGLVLTPVVLDTVYAQGRIEQGTTLYQALVYNEEDDVPITDRTQLVYRLAEIYEFKLDFTRDIQPGDSYRLVYEREVRPDGTARSQRILAADIVNQDKTYTSVWFSRGAAGQGYYDAEGRPLASGFSRYPVAYRVTSNFSMRRYHPILGIYRAHLGTDFGAPAGTSVEATANGTIASAGWSSSYGNLIVIRHANGYETRYAHLRAFAKGTRAGAHVAQKQVIGYVGSTGLATAAHLHYELRKGGRAINARTAQLPAAPPLAGAALDAFHEAAASRLALLDTQSRRYLARAGARGPKVADEN